MLCNLHRRNIYIRYLWDGYCARCGAEDTRLSVLYHTVWRVALYIVLCWVLRMEPLTIYS